MPPHPDWVQRIVNLAAENLVPTWFAGFGEFAQVENPDRETDETLVYVNKRGEYRGRGAGSATNILSQTLDGETSATLTRKTVPAKRMLLNGKHYLEKPPMPVKLATHQIKDSVEALAQRLKA